MNGTVVIFPLPNQDYFIERKELFANDHLSALEALLEGNLFLSHSKDSVGL